MCGGIYLWWLQSGELSLALRLPASLRCGRCQVGMEGDGLRIECALEWEHLRPVIGRDGLLSWTGIFRVGVSARDDGALLDRLKCSGDGDWHRRRMDRLRIVEPARRLSISYPLCFFLPTRFAGTDMIPPFTVDCISRRTVRLLLYPSTCTSADLSCVLQRRRWKGRFA